VVGPSIGTISAFVVGIKQHSYVTTSDNRAFGCFGRTTNGTLEGSGQGDCDRADCIANFQIGGPSGWKGKVIGTSGIVYGLTGVCHQAANRILQVAGISLPAKNYPLIKRSVQTYGFLGVDHGWLPPETGWSYRWNQCLPKIAVSIGNKGPSVNWSGDSNNRDWKYRMPDPDFAGQDDQLKRELEFLIAEGLEGRTLEPETFQKLLAIQRQLRARQAELGNLAREELISDAEYLKGQKNALRVADVQGEELLGFEDYHRIFGDPETIDALVDEEVFFSPVRFG
jgi:hypothetical protein